MNFKEKPVKLIISGDAKEEFERLNKIVGQEITKGITSSDYQTLNVVLSYLEASGKILDGRKGILWIYNPSPKLDKAIKQGIEL